MHFEEQDERGNLGKRKFCEIDSDQPTDSPDCVSAIKVSSFSSSFTPPIINPSGYDMKAYQVARKTNTIVVMKTATEKTTLGVMLIRDLGLSVKSSGFKRLIVFLAPSVNLVKQHSQEIKMYSNLEVGSYYGARGVDKWTMEQWKQELNKHDVLVMTPQIFLEALRNSYVKFEMVCLIIIDECHLTTGNHPYAKLMKDFYHNSANKPKILGLTTSSIATKGQASELENILDSQMFNPEDKMIHMYYDPLPFCSAELKAKIETLLFEAKIETLQRRLSSDHADILYCLDNLGPLCAYVAAEVCSDNISDIKEEDETDSNLHKEFFRNIFSLIAEYFPHEEIGSIDSWKDKSSSVYLEHTPPKLRELIRLFDSFRDGKNVQCVICVERIITAKVIERFMKSSNSFVNFNISYLTGNNISTNEFFDSSRAGKVQLLFMADVAEEDIRRSNWSHVIYLDLPKLSRNYVKIHEQAMLSNAEFIVFLERENTKQRDHLRDLTQSELSLRESETTVYVVEKTGASATLDSSINILIEYCKKLPTEGHPLELKFGLLVPEESSYMYTLALPASAAVQKIVGPQRGSEQLAKQLVCLEACKKLHQIGALDDHLQPYTNLSEDNVGSDKLKLSSAGAGTTKRKELHGKVPLKALCGSWGESLDGAAFKAYRIDFSCNLAGELYSSFVLLLESALDDDVGNVEIDLYLVRKLVKASVSCHGQLNLNHEEMTKAKCFQEFFFNGLFGKLINGSKSSRTKREFLLQTETRHLWDPSYMFLLLPIETNDMLSYKESWRINWSAIDSCVSVVDFLKKNSILYLPAHDSNHFHPSPNHEVTLDDEHVKTNLIRFADGPFDRNSLEEKMVIAIHTGRIYSIVEVVEDSSAKSEFEGKSHPEYTTYEDYYYKKYGIVLKHPDQPLLRLKQSHNAHNLLVDFNNEGYTTVKERKPQVHSYLPPELLVAIEVTRNVVKSIYVLPSVMHRLETLMLASQLRKEINCRISNFSISSSLILEALTTLICCETFSMERLELLGDSVLKYSVSCYLYLMHPDKNEGQLSNERKSIICNANLHQLATVRGLQGYIRADVFEPRRWAAPGQRTLFPAPCKHGIDAKEVPLDPKFFTENPTVKLGKSCDMGHRWLVSKTIADGVEALIGAYYVSGGLAAALHMMRWLGIDVDFDPKVVIEAINAASLRSYVPKNDEFVELESKIGHQFSVKFLLKEAITHKSAHEPYSYERLEFLGDSVLDIVITRHLYETYTETGPGDMTDLRAKCVSNENFAQVAVRKNLYIDLLHRSTKLDAKIKRYLMSFPEPDETGRSIPAIQGPKALGDMVESITGAVLIDTRMNLSEVWRVIEPLLSPLVTPDKLELPPYRELIELCDSLGYHMRVNCVNHGENIHVTIHLQLHDVLLSGNGSEHNTKLAKGKAASCLLMQLQKRNISRKGSSKGSQDIISNDGLSHNPEISEAETDRNPPSEASGIPIIGPINTKKGGPRVTLFEFCKKHLWPMPTFETAEEKSRTMFQFGGEGEEKRTSFSRFTSVITLRIPNRETLKCHGEGQPDKKSSYDSSVMHLLFELERLGFLIIQK